MRGPAVYGVAYPPYQPGIMTRPCGGDALEDELRLLRGQNIDGLVSLLAIRDESGLKIALR